jgi:CheY-like chemotaxis protein
VPFDLTEVLPSTVKALAATAHAKGLELTLSMSQEIPSALIGDAGRLRQILTNLIGNSIKFTERGEVAVSVSTESADAGSVCLHFSVRDTGIGVPQDKLAIIFHPFEQADRSTTRKFGGTGLGLAISSRLVELMGGRIWAESKAGEGSTFHFLARFSPSPSGPRENTRVPMYDLHATPVLVVDDNATNRRILQELLLRWGMKPTLAESGFAALASLQRSIAEKNPFQLLLVDGHMPGMDGLELVRRVRGIPALASTVIMMLTSTQRGEYVQRCRELNVAHFLVKPVTQSELLHSILEIMNRVPAAVPERTAQPATAADSEKALRVLVAEDNAVNQRLATALLAKMGHRATVAGNGRAALKAVEEGAFDLVLMDVQMPEMDGFEATAAIRRWEKKSGRYTPIVAMTAHAMQGDREKCLAADMDGYVSKPINRQELESAIGQAMQANQTLRVP